MLIGGKAKAAGFQAPPSGPKNLAPASKRQAVRKAPKVIPAMVRQEPTPVQMRIKAPIKTGKHRGFPHASQLIPQEKIPICHYAQAHNSRAAK